MFLKAVCDQLHLFTYSILALEEHVLHADWLVVLFKCNNTVFWKLVDFVLKSSHDDANVASLNLPA